MKFRDMVESLQGDLQIRIRKAQKGDCEVIMQEIDTAKDEGKINQNEYELLMNLVNRKKAKMNENLNEAVDLEKESAKFIKLVKGNQHTSALVAAAELTGDKKLISVSNAILTILDYEGQNPISQYAHTIYSRVHEMGRKKFGKEEWDKYIYSNT